MPDPQIGSPDPVSYDSDLRSDVVNAITEEVTKASDTPAASSPEKPADAEPKTETAVTEPKADHPNDARRYADGTFKPVKGEEKPAETTPAQAAPEVKTAEQPQQQAAPAPGNPPPGWSVKSKAEWDNIPEHIRADIIKREQEVNNGFAQYSGMKELLPYAQRAQSQGQSLRQVLDSFIGMEELLRANPEQGFLTIASRLGVSPQRLANSFAAYAGQSNGQYAQQPGYQTPTNAEYAAQIDPSLLQQYVNPLAQEVNQLKSFVQQQHQAQQQAETSRYASAFNAAQAKFVSEPESRYFENVREQMAQLFATGILQETGDQYSDLKAAYEMACNMNPEIRKLLVNEQIAKTEGQRRKTEQEAAEKAKHASRSITGSSAAGAKMGSGDEDDSIEADVRRAYRAHTV